jgi:hypothetical protein
VLADEVLGKPIELGRGDAGLSVLSEQRNRVRDEPAGTCHALDFRR